MLPVLISYKLCFDYEVSPQKCRLSIRMKKIAITHDAFIMGVAGQ